MAVSANDIQGLYIAYFNRPADYLGLQFWTKAANDKGGDINVVANAFAASAEYTTLYAGKSTAQIIDTIYMNLFGRHAELDGIKFWGAALDNKVLGIGNIAFQIMKGAQDTDGGFQDKTAVSSKIAAATAFYNALDTAAEVIAYSGDAANALAKTWLSNVVDQATLDAATTDAALSAVTAAVVQSNVPVVPPKTFTLTTSPDTLVGGSGDDVFNANYDITNAAQTLSALDSIDGGAGNDTLNVVSTTNFAVASTATVKNVEAAKFISTGTVAGDVSGWTGLTSLTVTEAGGTAGGITAAATTNVTLTDSALAANSVSIQGGKDVTVTVAGATNTGTIAVGTTTAVTGAVSITAASASAGTNTSSAINVKGGTTVTVTESATNSNTAGQTNTQGAVGVTGTATTTAVTVNQGAAVSAVTAVTAVAGVTESNTVTFGALTAGQTVIIGGLTYTSTGASTAAQVAAAFASLAAGATQGGSTALGTFSGTLTGWKTSGITGGNVVTFTSSTANTDVADLTVTGTGAGAQTLAKVADGSAATAAVTGKGGIGLGAVTIADANAGSTTKAATISTVTLGNYGNSTISSNALSTLNLSGKSGTLAITSGLTTETVTTLNLNVNGLTGTNAITDSSNHYKTIAVNTGSTANSTIANINDSAATALTVAGSKGLTLTSVSGLSALKTVTVTGAAGLKADVSGLASVTDVNASASSGTNTITLDATAATYEGGSGADTVTILANPTKAISGGAGADTLVVNIAGGFNAASNSLITGFETLGLGSLAQGTYVATNFAHLTEGAVAAAVAYTNVAAGTDLAITASTGFATTYTLADASGTADALTVKLSGSGANIDANTLNAAGIEKITLAVTDSNGDGAGAYTDTLTLVDTAAKSITITGDTNLNLTVTGNVALTSIDASASTGGLTVTTAGTVAEVVKGGAGVNSLTALTGTSADTLIGGASADTLVANAGLDTLTGGGGADTFVVAAVGANVNTYTTITDIAKGDILQLKNQGLETFGATKVSLAGTAVFQDYANAVVAAGGNAATNAYIGWFQFGGDTYIVESMHNGSTTPSFVNGTDLVVKLTGLIDLAATASPASFTNNGAGNTGIPQITFG